MKEYLYPSNLKSKPMLWFWKLRDVTILGLALLVSIFSMVELGITFPMVLTLVYMVMTIQMENTSILDYLIRAIRFYLASQQFYLWKERESK